MKNQCKHTRQTRILEIVRCIRPATKDGYCTRHHPSYLSPKNKAAMEELDRRE